MIGSGVNGSLMQNEICLKEVDGVPEFIVLIVLIVAAVMIGTAVAVVKQTHKLSTELLFVLRHWAGSYDNFVTIHARQVGNESKVLDSEIKALQSQRLILDELVHALGDIRPYLQFLSKQAELIQQGSETQPANVMRIAEIDELASAGVISERQAQVLRKQHGKDDD